jgi:RNA polymerase sigma-70 factor, ECF subfamily
MTRVAEKNHEALAELYDGTSSMIYSLVLRILKDSTAAEDVVLEVYLHAWLRAASYDPARGSVTGWLMTMARSRAIDCLRARKGRRMELQVELTEVAGLRDTRLSPETLAVEAGRAHVVKSAMAKLPPDQRTVIELSFFSGLSHGEIASRSSIPLGTVKTRIRLGILRLREFLQPCEAAL